MRLAWRSALAMLLCSGAALAVEPLTAVDGWAPKGATRVYTGAELYGFIDGGSEIFLELGFDHVAVQDYSRGGDEVTVELYHMNDEAAAREIYHEKCGTETPSPEVAARNTLGRYQLALQRSRVYAVITSPSGATRLISDLVEFGRSIAASLPEDAPAPALVGLDPEGRVPGTERLVRGPVGLQSILTLGDGDILSLGGRITAGAATYGSGAASFTRLVVPYADAAEAERAFAHLSAHLDPYLEVLAKTDSRLVFKDYAGRFGDVRLRESQLRLDLGLQARPGGVPGGG